MATGQLECFASTASEIMNHVPHARAARVGALVPVHALVDMRPSLQFNSRTCALARIELLARDRDNSGKHGGERSGEKGKSEVHGGEGGGLGAC
jgi:hypothetical protein